MTKKNINNKAFTLIEVLVVATIIAVLVTIASVSFANSQKRSRDSRRKADLETMRQALVLYRQDEGIYNISGGFQATVSRLYTAGYLTANTIADPKDLAPYEYGMSCITGADVFTCLKVRLTAYLENDPNPDYEILTP